MNNLKRVLSLGLAGTMLTGMMMVGAGAANKDFTDQEDITHTEAVDVMSTLGVLIGKDTGAFDPKGTVTRAEMAKIICVMRNGGVDPTLGTGATPMFSDVTNHWARSYIEYCANLGIIAGQGDGTFAPDATVTGAAAAKMLLVALGYDSDVFGFTGIDWQLNTDLQANDAKLYDEIKGIDTSAGLSRDNVAQMAYNALEARIMDRTFDKVASSGEISYNYFKSDETFLNEYFDAYTFVGKMTGNSDTDSLSTAGQIVVYGKLDTESDFRADGVTTNKRTATFPSELDISNIGEEVKVIFKDGKGGTANRPDKNDTIYGVFNTHNTQVIEATLNDIKNGSDSPAAANKMKIGSDEYTVAVPDDTTTVLVDANYGRSRTPAGATTAAAAKAIFEALKVSQSGDTVKFVCNDDGEITTAYVVNTQISYVTAVTNEKITIASVGTIKIADNDIYEGVAKNDIVTYTKFYDSNKDDAFFTVTKAEAIEGEMTGFKQDGVPYVNISLDGTTYKTDRKALGAATIDSDTTKTSFAADDIGENFTAYMVNGYVGYVIQNSDSANKLALVIDVDTTEILGSTLKAPKVQLLLADGTKVIASVDEDSVIYKESGSTHFQNDGGRLAKGTALSSGTALEKGQIVRYSVTSGGTYKLVEVPNAGANGYTNVYGASSLNDVAYSKDTKSVSIDNQSTSVVTDGSCVLFVKQTNLDSSVDYKAYNIRNLNDVKLAASTNVGYVTKDGKALGAYVELAGRPSGSSSSMTYGIVSAYNGTTKDTAGDSYKSYTVENNNDSYTLLMDTSSTKIPGTGALVGFEPSSDNVYNDSDITVYDGTDYTDKAKGLATWVKEYSAADKTLTYWGSVTGTVAAGFTGSSPVTVALDDDCVIAYVNADGKKAGDDVSISEFDATTGYKNVLLVKDDSTAKVVGIFVESSRDASVLKTVAAAPTTVQLVSDTATIDSSPVTLTVDAGSPDAATMSSFVDSSADKVKFTITNAAGTTSTAKLTIDSGATVDYTSGTPVDVADATGTVTCVLTVTVAGGAGVSNGTYTYTVNITVNA